MPLPGFPAGWAVSPHLKQLPFTTREDVLALLPNYMRESESVVRDRLVDALLLLYARLASDNADFAASADPLFATGSRLDLHGWARFMPRMLNEEDEAYRSRILRFDSLATVNGVMSAIYEITSAFSPARPYYSELPDDDVYLFNNNVAAEADEAREGFYFTDDYPIEAHARRYDARPNSRPRHAFLWGTFRFGDTTRRDLTRAPTLEGFYDYTDVFNAYGHAIVGIPAFPVPGTQDPHDALLRDDPSAGGTVALVGPDGVLTAAATAAAAAMGETFNLGTASDLGSHLFDSDKDAAMVVDRVRAVLATSSAFPVHVDILLDPLL